MNKIIKNIGLLALTGLLFTACNEDDASGDSQVDFSTRQVTLTSDMNNVVVDESAIDTDNPTVITVTATLNEASPVAIRVPLEWKSGTADGADFTIGGEIVIGALQTSGSTTVTIEQTGDIEGNETFTIGAGATANASVSPFQLKVDIENDYINTVIDLEITWDGQVTIEEEDVSTVTAELCAIDYDFILFDANTFAALGYILASGSCPESGSFAFGDGEYIIVAELYDNPHANFGDSSDTPITVNWEHEYFASGSVTGTGLFTLSDTAGQAPLALLNVSNGGQTYEVLPY